MIGTIGNRGSNIGSGGGTVDTELPTATLLADDTANPTVPGVASFGMVYDGTTWDRMRGTSVDGVLINLGSNNDVIQSTHDNFNANANIQVGNVDASGANPVPVSIIGGSGGFDDGDAVDTDSQGNLLIGVTAIPGTARAVRVSDGGGVHVLGPIALGAATSGTNPLLIGGEDPSGNLTRIQTAPDGDVLMHHHDAQIALVDTVSNTQYIDVNSTDLGFKAHPIFGYWYNGTTWDRARGTSGSGLLVDLGANNDVTVTSGSISATQGTSPWVTADNQTITDNAGFTDGTSKVFTSGHIFDEVAGTALTENDAAASRIDSKRAQVFVMEDETTRGRRATVTAANAVKVDGSAVTQPVSLAAGATSIGKAEDVASANADVGVPAMAVQKATPANTAGTDGDYEFLQMSAGRLWASATIDAAIPTGANTIGSIASITTSVVPGTAATNLGKAEDVAHAGGDTGVAVWAVRNDNGGTTFTNANGDYSPISVNSIGALYIGSIVPGTSTTELGKAEDAASGNADVGVMALAKRLDTPVANANVSADADYLPLITDNLGKLWTAQTQTEDAAHASGDRGAFVLGVSNTNLATTFGASGDYTPIATAIDGAVYKAVYRATTTLTALNTTYDDSPTTATSASVDTGKATRGTLMFSITESGAATDITIEMQYSDDNSTWFPHREDPWTDLSWDDATVAAYSTLSEAVNFEIPAQFIRFVVTCTGTDASNSFTVANARVVVYH